MSNIPRVRRWKVTAVETGRSVEVWTINRKFAKWIACTDFGMWGQTLKISPMRWPRGAPQS